ncbi:hypothetical protein BASA60_000664 [Batrachochytrium salamandrivorans]|nr:hypothetical protein BASA60_000664 [Batrachochytrium salamandrivorans]
MTSTIDLLIKNRSIPSLSNALQACGQTGHRLREECLLLLSRLQYLILRPFLRMTAGLDAAYSYPFESDQNTWCVLFAFRLHQRYLRGRKLYKIDRRMMTLRPLIYPVQ